MPIRIIFLGTPEFACPFLQALSDESTFDVVQVITQPDKPVGRGKKLTSPPVKDLAKKLKIPVIQPLDINSDFKLQATSYKLPADFLVVVVYGQILSKEVLALPKIAPVNVHASLLPRWRGASPIEHSILAGDTETGITIQRMVPELDAGPILAKERTTVAPRETRITLAEKMMIIGPKRLIETLKGPIHETPQDESGVTVCKKLTREMGIVDPEIMTAEEIDRRVRALVPWPGVVIDNLCHAERSESADERRRSTQQGEQIKLIETSLEPDSNALPIRCAKDTTLYILKLQAPTKKVMTGAEWGRGHDIQ